MTNSLGSFLNIISIDVYTLQKYNFIILLARFQICNPFVAINDEDFLIPSNLDFI